MDAAHLSKALRETTDATMRRRRGVIGLSLAAAGSMALIALYQSGVIQHLREPPLPKLDAGKVDASPEAFERLEVGDAFDVATAAKLTLDQWTKHKAFCFWCLTAAAATFATAPLVVDEARRALAALSPHSNQRLLVPRRRT